MAPVFRYWDGKGSLVAFVVSLNLKRRHLNESQRAMVAAKIANMERTDTLNHGSRSANLRNGKVSQLEAAKLLNVSDRSVTNAKSVREKAVPDLVAAVEKGEVAVSTAAVIAQAPPDEQVVIIAQGYKGVVEAIFYCMESTVVI